MASHRRVVSDRGRSGLVPREGREAVSVLIELEDEEVAVVTHALDLHEEGLCSARDCTIEDPNVVDANMLLELVGDYDEELTIVRNIKRRLM